MKIAFLGLGKMGVPIVDLLLRAGHDVTVWNRTPKSLDLCGISCARAASSIANAVANCDIAFTMLANDAATEMVAFGEDGLIAHMPKDAIHVSLGTLGVAFSRCLAAAHRDANQQFVAAPVFGRPNVATQGRLWIMAAGDPSAIEKVRPVLQKMGRGLTILGDHSWQAHAAKLAGNMLIASMVQSLSEAFVFAAAYGLDLEVFLETINEALFESPMYLNYGRIMLDPPEHPGATVLLGAKDTHLLREAAKDAAVRLGLANYLQEQLNASIHAGMGEMDWPVGQYRQAKLASKTVR